MKTRWQVHVFDTVTSTNDVARQFTPRADAWHLVLAAHQTAGRGQYGRAWTSAPGRNMLATFVVPAAAIRAAAVGVCDVLRAHGLAARCKWPNDVQVDGAKVAGILVERCGDAVQIGIGLNVHWPAHAADAGCSGNWTSMAAATGRQFDCARLARETAAALEQLFTLAAPELLQQYRRHCASIGGPVEVMRARRWRQGTVQDIGPDGSMLVALPSDGTIHVRSSAHVRQSAA